MKKLLMAVAVATALVGVTPVFADNDSTVAQDISDNNSTAVGGEGSYSTPIVSGEIDGSDARANNIYTKQTGNNNKSVVSQTIRGGTATAIGKACANCIHTEQSN